MGIVINHYKDPYDPTSIMDFRKAFECCSIDVHGKIYVLHVATPKDFLEEFD